MSEPTDFARLSRNWTYWSNLGQLDGLSVSTDCDDCEVAFGSNDYSVHLRHDGDWWVVDTINDRGQRQHDTAKFSTFELVEKYLVWTWASLARSVISADLLGRKLFDTGFDPSVERTSISTGIYELQSDEGRAVLMEPYATIFSRLFGKTEQQIEQMVLADLGGQAPI